ncbi:DUF1641 domain-containing protein [Neobacillus piezotolerans]|uniref:DUF1641 domain-containing protein n=1 Tax=Neobacillus piezotolerans TaxID=2259171 RepID=A0A3D8GQV8_9BACI|nr:DUF1641 domain-containing protein [Neobacillus piezotolerans]RDU36870.1 DUF1641 domain-containing protein [Neobacillus piezotolerans]
MAKAIKQIKRIEITEEQKHERDLHEVEEALLKNKEAILETLEVLGHMKERGVLSLASALFGQGDKVLHTLVKAADKPEAANTLKNLLLLVGVLGTLNVSQLEPLLLKLNSGIARVAKYRDNEEEIGYFDIFRSLKDPEVNNAIGLLFEFMKGMGEDTSDLERNTQLPEDQALHKVPHHSG